MISGVQKKGVGRVPAKWVVVSGIGGPGGARMLRGTSVLASEGGP